MSGKKCLCSNGMDKYYAFIHSSTCLSRKLNGIKSFMSFPHILSKQKDMLPSDAKTVLQKAQDVRAVGLDNPKRNVVFTFCLLR